MDGENARRNLRDFLSMYNQFTETCFERCIQNLNYRILTPDEESCTNKCVSKLINVNHREISVYMEINPLNRRLNELGTGTNPSELQAPPPDLLKELEKAQKDNSALSPQTDDSTAAAENSTAASKADIVSKDSSNGDATLVTELPKEATNGMAGSGKT